MAARIVELLDPTARAVISEAQIAPRVTDLNGKVIGFLDNAKANADIVLARVEELLSYRFKFADIVHASKGTMGGAFAYPTDLSEKLSARCDVVVNGVGD